MRSRDVGIVIPLMVSVLAASSFAACGRSPASHVQLASSAGALGETLARPAASEGAAAPVVQVGSLAPLARRVTPAVVAIQSLFNPDSGEVASTQGPQLPPGLQPPGGMMPFAPPQESPSRGLGTGFLITSDGYILTNNHVVANAQHVSVGLEDHRIFTAKVIGRDPATDVALIKIDASNLPTLPLGDDSTTRVGDAVMAVGNPLGLDFTVTSGIVSAKGRGGSLRGLFRGRYAIVDFIQTDAVINPGNSGGPLVDMQGRVIGINSAIASPTGSFAGYGFAVPISIARIVMEDLRKYGRVRHAILGVTVQDVGPADARAADLKEIQGVLVGGAEDKSPAAKADVHPGDIITAINGRPVDRVSTLQRIIFGFQPGQSVTLDINRYGTHRTAQVTLGEPPDEASSISRTNGKTSGTTRLGIGVVPVSPEIADRMQLPRGTGGLLVEQVDPAGPAAAAQLQRGDIIESALGRGSERPIRSIDDLRDALSHASNGVLSLLVYAPQARGTRVVNIDAGQQ